jgi:peptidyl-prolyl cis-trans isomerase C
MKKMRAINCCFILLAFGAMSFVTTPTSIANTDSEKKKERNERKVVARVNGQPVYENQLAEGVNKSLKKWKKYGMKQQTPALTYRLQTKALNKVIDDELVIQAAQQIKVTDLDKKVDQKIRDMKKRYRTDKQFEDHLQKRNLSQKKLRENLTTQVYVDEYLKQKGISDPDIPEVKIREFYDSSPENYARKETIEVSHILIKVDEGAGPEEKEKAYLKIEEIRKEIIKGKDFAEMAKEHSQCNSASGGGSLRYIERGYMPTEFDEVAFTIEKDTVSEIVETTFGYHIILVTDKKSGGIAPYEEVRDFIKKYLQKDESQKRLAEHIALLREKATIEILLEDPTKKE